MTDPSNLAITVNIGSHAVQAIVDTGAQVSVLSSALAQKWFPDYPYTVKSLQGIGNQQVQAKMIEGVTFTVGDKSFTGRMYIADIPDDMLIGIDVLRALDAEIHFATNEIVIGNQVIVAAAVKDSTTGKRSEKRQVYLVGRAKIPAHSTTYAIGRVTAPLAKTFLVEPAREKLPCLVPASLHS
jgi:hypothetical protein